MYPILSEDRSLVITENPDDLGKGDNMESKIHGNSGNRYASQLRYSRRSNLMITFACNI